MVAALDEAYRAGELELRGVEGFGEDVATDAAWLRLKRKLFRVKWVSYAKPPFAGAEEVYRYLGRYTHRVGLSNHRLLSASADAVTFRTRGEATATLHPHDFLHRFLQHVLPPGFVKLRHYGLLAPGNVNTRLAAARVALERRGPLPTPAPPTSTTDTVAPPPRWRELLLRLTGIDVSSCRKCGGPIRSRPLPRPSPKDTS